MHIESGISSFILMPLIRYILHAWENKDIMNKGYRNLVWRKLSEFLINHHISRKFHSCPFLSTCVKSQSRKSAGDDRNIYELKYKDLFFKNVIYQVSNLMKAPGSFPFTTPFCWRLAIHDDFCLVCLGLRQAPKAHRFVL